MYACLDGHVEVVKKLLEIAQQHTKEARREIHVSGIDSIDQSIIKFTHLLRSEAKSVRHLRFALLL